jgi:hypothetical protein
MAACTGTQLHIVAPGPAVDCPSGQIVQTTEPLFAEYLLVGHTLQAAVPVFAAKLPAPHGVQLPDRAVGLKVPAAQYVHFAARVPA